MSCFVKEVKKVLNITLIVHVNVHACVCGYNCNEWLLYDQVIIISKWLFIADTI